MDEHKKFLADRLLSEEQPITYRLLSRALDVHVNTAKEMLYDFHAYQNAQKANSVHATYLIHGTKAGQGDGDVEMASSAPDHEPLSETVPTAALTLVREENLSSVLSEYQAVDSIHIYSLAPSPQRDLSLLSDLTKSLYEYSVKEDPTKAAEKYGTIGNPSVRRRARAPKAAAPAAAKPSAKPAAPAVKAEPAAKPAPSSAPAASKVKQEPAADKPPKKESTPSSSAAKTAPPAKRGAAGGIMQSFAKAAAKPKPKKEPVKQEPALSDDGEADDDDNIPTVQTSPRAVEARRQAQKKRTESLKRMMEEESDEDADKKDDEDEDEEMEEAPEPEEEPEPEPEPEAKKVNEGPSEIVSSTDGGRRRGRRRVMQKKRILDDEGFMVTIQEPGWESFSEDEAPPPAKKPTPAPTPASSASAPKPKKPAAKTGQGNIMSFFAKK